MRVVIDIFQPVIVTTSRGAIVPLWGDENGEIGAIDFQTAGLEIPTDGMAFSTKTLVETLEVGMQPKSLNEYQIAEWGINTTQQDAKIIYDFSLTENLKIGNRIRANGQYFDIKAKNPWGNHQECIVVPVQGQA